MVDLLIAHKWAKHFAFVIDYDNQSVKFYIRNSNPTSELSAFIKKHRKILLETYGIDETVSLYGIDGFKDNSKFTLIRLLSWDNLTAASGDRDSLETFGKLVASTLGFRDQLSYAGFREFLCRGLGENNLI